VSAYDRRHAAASLRAPPGLAAVLIAYPVVSIMVLRWVPPPLTTFMIHDRARALLARSGGGLHYRWTGWSRISPHARIAVVAAEDQNFPRHSGFDVGAIQDAVQDHRRGKRLRGASTISQQVAKNLFLWPSRSFVRKGLEAYLTVLIEFFWPKQRILEVYLNVAEMGPGVFGVGAASRAYFDKPPGELTAYEAALLAAVLPNPKRLHADRPSAYVRGRASWINGQMNRLGGAAYLDGL
jgi:monofunctional biosynthetic peptidoglycan transglycosylase